ncbi:hypothetical protein ACHWUR_00420 [Klebsiella pneumoniae]
MLWVGGSRDVIAGKYLGRRTGRVRLLSSDRRHGLRHPQRGGSANCSAPPASQSASPSAQGLRSEIRPPAQPRKLAARGGAGGI